MKNSRNRRSPPTSASSLALFCSRFLCTTTAILLLVSVVLVTVTTAASSDSGAGSSGGGTATDTKTKGPPAFFLQDPSDSLCLSGETFKRCSIDTLWFAKGDPGNFRIHKRPIDDSEAPEEDDDGTCLTKQKCNDMSKSEDLKLAKCSHCGAKNWNILGDANTGYVLTVTSPADEKKDEATESIDRVCLKREKDGKKATMAPCDLETAVASDLPYTPLMLQFVSAAEITGMSSPGARLVTAATDEDKKTIQQMLKDGVDINFRDWDQLSALFPPASSGNLDLVKFLVKEGIDVNAQDKDGITALMEAATMGHVKVVEFLMDNGADVDTKSKTGITALWLAAGQGKVDVVKALLKKEAEVNISRNDGLSAVMTAAVGGHADCVKLLIDSGADITTEDQDGKALF